jgi:hypothetical protein
VKSSSVSTWLNANKLDVVIEVRKKDLDVVVGKKQRSINNARERSLVLLENE